MLDVGHTLFLWFGADSNRTEQQGTIALAQKYLKSDPTVRDNDTPILIIKQGHEPPTFTGFFGVWDRGYWNVRSSASSVHGMQLMQHNIFNVMINYSGKQDLCRSQG